MPTDRPTLRLLAALLFGGLVAAPNLAAPHQACAQTAGSDLSGTLDSINSHSGEIVVRTRRGVRRGVVDAGTLITIDGFPGSLTDLRPGFRVTLQYVMGADGRARVQIARLSVSTR